MPTKNDHDQKQDKSIKKKRLSIVLSKNHQKSIKLLKDWMKIDWIDPNEGNIDSINQILLLECLSSVN